MVRPVGVDHADFSDGRGALFGLFKIFLAEGNVSQIHCQTVLVDKVLQALLVQLTEAVQHCYISRNLEWGMQGLCRFQRCLHRLYRVDEVCLDAGKLLVGHAADDINLCGSNGRTLMLGCQLDALCRRICTLVKLSRQELYCKQLLPLCKLRQAVIDIVYLWLREDGIFCKLKILC